TLTERIASLKQASYNTSDAPIRDDLARRCLERWRSQSPFADDSYFAQRLVMDGMTEEVFLCILGESIEAVRDRIPNLPTWLKEIAEAFSHSASVATNTISFPKSLGDQV